MSSSKFDKSAHVLNTSISFEWLEKTLQSCFKTSALMEDCKATRIAKGQGFLSYIIRIEPTWSEEIEALPKALILKVPTMNTFKNMDKEFNLSSADKDSMAMIADMMKNIDMEPLIKLVHQCECESYRLLAEWAEQLRMPKCYYQEMISDEHPGALIMEDLSERGVSKTLAYALDLESLLQVAESLATLHAWCLKNRSVWEGNPHLKSGFAYMNFMTDEQMVQNTEMLIKMLKKEHKEVFDPLADRFRDLIITKEKMDIIKHVHTDLNMPSVLVHGDLWINNMMFYKGKDDIPTNKIQALIDWQCVHTGCVSEDFSRLLTSSVTAPLRRQHTETVLKHYYNSLTEKLDGTDPGFTFDTLKESYRRLFAMGAAAIASALPLMAKQTDMLGEKPEEKAKELIERCQGLLEDAVEILDSKDAKDSA